MVRPLSEKSFDAIISISRLRPAMTIYDEVLTFIATPDDELFEPLALKVFGHQFRQVPHYQQYCISLGVSSIEQVESIDAIPPISTVAFKYASLGGGTAERVFL